MESLYTICFPECEISFTRSEIEKGRLLMYMYSGVRCYNKNGGLIKNPFDEFPESYTIDLTGDYHGILDDLSSYYVMEFPAPSHREMAEHLTNGRQTLKYACDNIPWSDSEYCYCGTFRFVDSINKCDFLELEVI